jgi:hypothetical protein
MNNHKQLKVKISSLNTDRGLKHEGQAFHPAGHERILQVLPMAPFPRYPFMKDISIFNNFGSSAILGRS